MADKTGEFDLPVDLEHKATKLKLLSLAKPHMRAFHVSWISFFTSFCSTFAAAALMPVIRDSLNLVKEDIGNSGIAAITGTIVSRLLMGTICDQFGPRYGHAFFMLLVSPAVICFALINNATGLIIGRLVIGFALATFVATQFWSSVMFNVKIVGIANATSAGWGNLGGGVIQLVMPQIFAGISLFQPRFVAWRYAFFVPGLMHVVVGTLVLFFTQDLPDGNYRTLKKAGDMKQDNGWAIWLAGVKNYRLYILMINYGLCFGVELTINNIITSYFVDQFGIKFQLAGVLGSLFGLMNIFARSLGGFISDFLGNRFGMRGRIWAYFISQFTEGIMCLILGFMQNSLAGTIIFLLLFSLFVQSAEGAAYGVVPFVSRRALGIISGYVGAGGNAGSMVLQLAFFRTDDFERYEGLRYMGVIISGLTALLLPLIYFPMWGSMFFGPKEGATEEEYYSSDFSKEEREQGLHEAVMNFAKESKSQRGSRNTAHINQGQTFPHDAAVQKEVEVVDYA